MSWRERALKGELNAVLSPTGSEKRNRFLHTLHLVGAETIFRSLRNKNGGILVDFGCGTGRFVRFFGERNYFVVGTEITPEMLYEAKRIGIPEHSMLVQTDGISIPLADRLVDIVWCCGVLRYSLFVSNPAYHDIAREMYRVLKPGGLVVNIEMYVDVAPELFTGAFERVGFTTRNVCVLQRYTGRLERFFQFPLWPLWFTVAGAKWSALYRLRYDIATRSASGLRDYVFVWMKPND